MIKFISHSYQLIADSHVKTTQGPPSQEDPNLENRLENSLVEDVLDDMGHFIRSVLYLLEQEGPTDKILNTIARLRLLVDIFDVQVEEMDSLWNYLLTNSDETIRCAVLFSLASVQREIKASNYLFKSLNELAKGVSNHSTVINALKLGQHPELDRQLKKKIKESDPTISAKIHQILTFRQKHKQFLYS